MRFGKGVNFHKKSSTFPDFTKLCSTGRYKKKTITKLAESPSAGQVFFILN